MRTLATEFIDTMLEVAGVQCSAMLSGSFVSFYGIINQSDKVMFDDRNQPYLSDGNVLTVNRTIGDQLSPNTAITIDGDAFQMTQKLTKAIGDTVLVSVVPVRTT